MVNSSAHTLPCWDIPLQVGVAKFSLAQQRSHFALWALVKAPLLLGANLELITPDSLKILTAREVGGGSGVLLGEGVGVG